MSAKDDSDSKCALNRRNILLAGTTLAAASALRSAVSIETAHAQAPPYNIVFLIVDQRAHRLLAGPDYALPGFDAIARHGVSFQNHYISSAMCTPSRASFLSGQPTPGKRMASSHGRTNAAFGHQIKSKSTTNPALAFLLPFGQIGAP